MPQTPADKDPTGNAPAEWRRGLRDGIPIFLGYLAVSFSFGILAKTSGLTPLQATLMSATNLTSAGQFAALGAIATLAPYIETAVLQLVINLRYSLMSCALSQKLDTKTPLLHRLLMAAGITDEIFGVSVTGTGKLSPPYLYGLLAAAWPGWTLGTLLGVIMGNAMPPSLLNALSIALYGMFIAVIVPPARRDRVIAGLVVLSMTASALCGQLPVLREMSAGIKTIALTVLLAGLAAFLFPVKEAADDRR